ncbi:unnamed protein product [Lathyrus sativus]|nr:unnamed protein product [Lathyrus sativus]CAK8089908.1 unnamed protein product [Lathyrus sativus]
MELHGYPSFTDLLQLKVHIHHFDSLSHIQCEIINVPAIVFKKLFSQEGWDYLRTQLSEVSFLTSNIIDHFIGHIIYEVQQSYNIDTTDEKDNSEPNVFNLNLEMEIHGEPEIEYYDEEIGMVPASKEAIERMKTTCDLNDTKLRDICCSICMDEFDDVDETSKICRMPCSHVFHEQCIVKWLQTSNTCPLCRYSMPTALDS